MRYRGMRLPAGGGDPCIGNGMNVRRAGGAVAPVNPIGYPCAAPVGCVIARSDALEPVVLVG